MPRMGTTMAMLRQRECDAQASCEVLSNDQVAALAADGYVPAKRKRSAKSKKKARARR